VQHEDVIILIRISAMSGKKMILCSFTANRTAAKQFCYIQGNPSAKEHSKVKEFNLTPHNHNISTKIFSGITEYTQKVPGLKIVFRKPTSLPVVKIAVSSREIICACITVSLLWNTRSA
jgi:hypothetical protein